MPATLSPAEAADTLMVLKLAADLAYYTNRCENSKTVCSKGNGAAYQVMEMAAEALGLDTKEAVYKALSKSNLMDEGVIDAMDLPRW